MNKIARRKLIYLFFYAIFVFVIITALRFYSAINRPIIDKGSDPVIVVLDKSSSASHFIHDLESRNLIYSAKVWMFLIRIGDLAHNLKAGVYQIVPGETVFEFLHHVSAGDVMTFNFTIIEGTTQTKVINDLMKAPYLSYRNEDWGAITKKFSNPEGMLLANTYQYQGNSSASTLLTQAYNDLTRYLNDSWMHRDTKVPYKTPYELLIAASIIEKEGAIPQERRLISGVLVNRLKKRMPLQMDPTVIYALGSQYKGTLAHNDLLINSPYNTYKNLGLPPTPIAMVGKDAIDAAAHPQHSNYLYYFAKGDGTHQFSETYKQQINAINQFKYHKAN
jgi:UPF0755 protein